VLLVDFIIRIYHEARSSERQTVNMRINNYATVILKIEDSEA